MAEHLRTLPVTLDDLRQLAAEQRLYAVLDACDEPNIQAKVSELGVSGALCLYRGKVSPEMLEIAPYLVRMDEAILEWLVETVWGEPWGIFLVAKLEPEAIRKHLRKFLIVKDPDGEAMYFRYYDPRVLPTFLESCNRHELDNFFGGMTALGYTAGTDTKEGFLFQRIQSSSDS